MSGEQPDARGALADWHGLVASYRTIVEALAQRPPDFETAERASETAADIEARLPDPQRLATAPADLLEQLHAAAKQAAEVHASIPAAAAGARLALTSSASQLTRGQRQLQAYASGAGGGSAPIARYVDTQR